MSEESVRTARGDRVVYWVAIGVLVVLTLVALLAFRQAREQAAATQKAEELVATLEAAGVERLPSVERVARVLGDDGGSVCAEPGDALRRSTLLAMLTNGASGPGVRPVIVESRLFEGQVAVMSVYCPEHLEDVRAYLDELKTADAEG